MKRYTSCLVFAAWLCASAKADDDSGYTPPQPLREAVTARSAATDINDTSLAGTPEKSPVEVAESLRQGVSTPKETPEDATLNKSAAESALSGTESVSLPQNVSRGIIIRFSQSATPAVVPQIDEISEKPMAPAMVQTKKRLLTDPITEMMGGEFNTEANQRMAESFLSVRPRVLHLKANRDF
ncbi:hypothetical protein Efla_005802 [Eimeria flavescens]